MRNILDNFRNSDGLANLTRIAALHHRNPVESGIIIPNDQFRFEGGVFVDLLQLMGFFKGRFFFIEADTAGKVIVLPRLAKSETQFIAEPVDVMPSIE